MNGWQPVEAPDAAWEAVLATSLIAGRVQENYTEDACELCRETRWLRWVQLPQAVTLEGYSLPFKVWVVCAACLPQLEEAYLVRVLGG